MKPTGAFASTATNIGSSAASRTYCSNDDSIANQSGKARRMLSQVCALARGSVYSTRIMASVVPEVRLVPCQSQQGRRPSDLRLGQTMTIVQHRPSPSDNHVREWPFSDTVVNGQ